MSQRWWEKWPERLEFELNELAEHGISYEIDHDEKKAGRLVLNLYHILNGESLLLIAKFPDNYPFFRFEVRAPELDLPRHQNPYEKNLCLIGRATANWNSTEDTLARYITDQLPKLLQSARSNGDELEEEQGEPISEYYPYFGRMILIDGSWVLDPTSRRGVLEIGFNESTGAERMAVVKITDVSGRVIAEANPSITNWYQACIKAQWVRLDEPIKTASPEEFFVQLCNNYPYLQNLAWRRDRLHEHDFAIVGATFPEEIGYKKMGDGWIFITVCRKKIKVGKKKKWKSRYLYARAGRAGPQDMLERTPHLSFLGKKKVVAVGLGSIGAPSVLEFARNGVGELRLVDDDHVDPGTIVRWPLGFCFISSHKTDALSSFISQNYPYTKVFTHRMHIGAIDCLPQNDIIENILTGADLIYDATAEVGVHHFLAERAREMNIPYILASATPGAWGGLIARFLQGKPCWVCFERARTEGKLQLPPESPEGKVQPAGCGNPTFTGASFDLQEIAFAGVRLAIATLSPSDKYGNCEWDAANVSFRDDGKLLLPNWVPLSVEKYSDCACG